MKLQEIYSKYLIPENLQLHMMRVAGLAEILLKSWQGKQVSAEHIVRACLLHDIAKPINFDLAKQAKWGMTPKDIAALKTLQEQIRSKYGNDEHTVLVALCRASGIREQTVRIVNNTEWSLTSELLKRNDWESLIAIYADRRVGPEGLLSLEERFNDLQKRGVIEDANTVRDFGKKLEQELSIFLKINPNSVTNEEIEKLFPVYLSREI